MLHTSQSIATFLPCRHHGRRNLPVRRLPPCSLRKHVGTEVWGGATRPHVREGGSKSPGVREEGKTPCHLRDKEQEPIDMALKMYRCDKPRLKGSVPSKIGEP